MRFLKPLFSGAAQRQRINIDSCFINDAMSQMNVARIEIIIWIIIRTLSVKGLQDAKTN